MHPERSLLSDLILGSQDGLVNVLGIILGITAATVDLRLILVATLAALAAESISMGAVAYTSTLARRRLYLSEQERERREMREIPDMEREEVREILARWGYAGAELDEMLDRVARNPQAMLEFMMAFELRLQPVEPNDPRKSLLRVGVATVAGSVVPLLPFLLVPGNIRTDVILSVIVSAVTLFLIGWYEARTTAGSVWRSGVQMAAIGLTAGFAGFLIGHFLGTTPGL